MSAHDSETIPMAPSTALLIVLGSIAFGSLYFSPRRNFPRIVAEVAGLLITAIGALVIVQQIFEIDSGWESRLAIPGTTHEGITIGRMSPFTAGVFILTALNLWTLHPQGGHRLLWRRVGRLGGMFATGFCAVVVVTYVVHAPLFHEGTLVPVARSTGVALGALNLGILVANGTFASVRAFFLGKDAVPEDAAKADRGKGIFLFGTSAVLVVTAAVGVLILSSQQSEQKRRLTNELTAIAVFKVRQLIDWRDEELRDARMLTHAPYFARSVSALAADRNDTAARSHLRGWMRRLQETHGYSAVAVFDHQNRLVLAEANSPDVTARNAVADLPSDVRMRDATMTDFSVDPSGAVRLDLIAPVFEDGQAEPVGTILLRYNPKTFLYPLLQAWPLPTETGETLLLRREGREVVYLNARRQAGIAAAPLRRPIDEPRLLSARAVRGERGFIEDALDYRGRTVVGVARVIPGTPWVLVVKMDQSEALAAMRRRAWSVIAATLGLMGGIALGAGLMWRGRRLGIVQAQISANKAREAVARRLALLMREANDIILMVSEEGRILEANARAVDAYGYSQEELCRMHVRDLRPDESPDRIAADLRRGATPTGYVFQTTHHRRDGTSFPVEVSSRLVEVDDERVRLSVIRDITDRKRDEAINASRLHITQYAVSHSLDEFWEETLNEAERLTGSRLGFSYFVQPDQPTPVRQNWSTRTRASGGLAGEKEALSEVAFWTQWAKQEKPAIYNDPTSLPDRGDRSAAAIALHRALVVPVMRGGAVKAILGVGNKPRDYVHYDATALSLLAELAWEIADRKRAEERLRESDERLRIAFQTSPDACLIVRRDDGLIVEVNERMVQMYGFAREEMIGRSSLELGMWADPDARKVLLAELDARNRVENFEVRARRKGGETFWVSYSLATLASAGPRFCIGIIHDITESKRAAEELRSSEARFRTLIEKAPTAIGLARDAKTIYVNSPYRKLFGVPDDFDVVGYPIASFWAPEFREQIAERSRRRTRGERVVTEYEGIGQRMDGSKFFLHLAVSIVDLPDGPATMAVCTALNHLATHAADCALVITDIDMPGMDGNRLATLIRTQHPAIVVLKISGSADARRRIEAEPEYAPGGFLSKPFTADELLRAVVQLLSAKRPAN